MNKVGTTKTTGTLTVKAVGSGQNHGILPAKRRAYVCVWFFNMVLGIYIVLFGFIAAAFYSL